MITAFKKVLLAGGCHLPRGESYPPEPPSSHQARSGVCWAVFLLCLGVPRPRVSLGEEQGSRPSPCASAPSVCSPRRHHRNLCVRRASGRLGRVCQGYDSFVICQDSIFCPYLASTMNIRVAVALTISTWPSNNSTKNEWMLPRYHLSYQIWQRFCLPLNNNLAC